MSQFGTILDILMEAFKNPVSEQDYHNIVELLRAYKRDDVMKEQEMKELSIREFPLTYHPCDHMERIRFAMTFTQNNNERIKELFARAV